MHDRDFEQRHHEQLYQINRELADHTDRLTGLENKAEMLIDGQQRTEKRISYLERDMTDIKTNMNGMENRMGSMEARMGSMEKELTTIKQLLNQLIGLKTTAEG